MAGPGSGLCAEHLDSGILLSITCSMSMNRTLIWVSQTDQGVPGISRCRYRRNSPPRKFAAFAFCAAQSSSNTASPTKIPPAKTVISSGDYVTHRLATGEARMRLTSAQSDLSI